MGLKESTINLCADKLAEAFENANNLGNVLSGALSAGGSYDAAKKVFGLGSVVGSVTTGLVDGIHTSMQPVAIAISMLFFLISTIELANSDRFSLEQFIKFFSKFIISFFLIVNCKDLLSGIATFGDGFLSLMDSASVSGSGGSFSRETFKTDVVTAFEGVEDLSFIDPLIIMIVTVAPMGLATMAMTIVAYVIAASRAIELLLRGSMMPIAFGLISDDGWRGAGGRYIKKYVALVTQGAALVLIGKITNAIMGAVGTELLNIIRTAGSDKDALYAAIPTALVIVVSVGIASISMMFKSIGVVNDVFGA